MRAKDMAKKIDPALYADISSEFHVDPSNFVDPSKFFDIAKYPPQTYGVSYYNNSIVSQDSYQQANENARLTHELDVLNDKYSFVVASASKMRAQAVRFLCFRTGAGIDDAKKAYSDANYDIAEAMELLRSRGMC